MMDYEELLERVREEDTDALDDWSELVEAVETLGQERDNALKEIDRFKNWLEYVIYRLDRAHKCLFGECGTKDKKHGIICIVERIKLHAFEQSRWPREGGTCKYCGEHFDSGGACTGCGYDVS